MKNISANIGVNNMTTILGEVDQNFDNALAAFQTQVKQYNSAYNGIGFARVGDSTPADVSGNVYLAMEAGTIFGIADVERGQWLVGTGSTGYTVEPIQSFSDVIQPQINAIEEEITINDQLQSTSAIIPDFYINSAGTLIANSSYSVKVYGVSEGDFRRVLGKLYSLPNVMHWCLYEDINCTVIVAKGTYTAGTVEYDESFEVNEGGNYVGITNYSLNGADLYDSTKENREEIRDIRLLIQGNNEINCFGDSLTAGSGGTPYTTQLQTLLGIEYKVNRIGVGGESSIEIASRQGGIAIKTKNDISLPVTTTAVQIGDFSDSGLANMYNGGNLSLLRQGSAGVNPIYIDGIECYLAWTGATFDDPFGTYELTRSEAGDARTIPAGTPIFTNASRMYRSGLIDIYYAGTNGGWSSSASELRNQVEQMVRFHKNNNFIVIGLHTLSSGFDLVALEALEDEFEKQYGLKYINFRRYLITNALADAGITPTTADNDAIALGQCPPSLLSDPIHFNTIGYKLLSEQVYQRMQELNYFI